MELLYLIGKLNLLIFRFSCRNLSNQLIDFVVTHTVVNILGVEVLGAICHIRAYSPTGKRTIVTLRTHDRVKIRLWLIIVGYFNTSLFKLLLYSLEFCLGDGITAESSNRESCSLTVLLVKVTALGVPCFFQNLLGSICSRILRNVILISLLERHSEHRPGHWFFPANLLKGNIC